MAQKREKQIFLLEKQIWIGEKGRKGQRRIHQNWKNRFEVPDIFSRNFQLISNIFHYLLFCPQ